MAEHKNQSGLQNFSCSLPVRVGDLSVKGFSLAGVGTSLVIPELSLAFDVAQGGSFNYHLQNFAISHGHMDHGGGIPYIISQAALNKLPPPKFFVPQAIVEPLEKIMDLWASIEQFSYQYQLTGVSASSQIPLNSMYRLEAFQTKHRVPSLGYSIIRLNTKLKKEYQGLSQEKILEIKNQGLDVTDLKEERLVSFTGDTQIEFLDLSPQVKKSKLLFVEVTYVDEKKSVEEARTWGHIHLDEIIPRLSELECEKIIFIHKSRRYSDRYINQILNQKIPKQFWDRVYFLGEPQTSF